MTAPIDLPSKFDELDEAHRDGFMGVKAFKENGGQARRLPVLLQPA